MRRVRIVEEVLRRVASHPNRHVRQDFARAYEMLTRAKDARSWDELRAVPVKDEAGIVPADTWMIPFAYGGIVIYVITEEGAEIFSVYIPDSHRDS